MFAPGLGIGRPRNRLAAAALAGFLATAPETRDGTLSLDGSIEGVGDGTPSRLELEVDLNAANSKRSESAALQ